MLPGTRAVGGVSYRCVPAAGSGVLDVTFSRCLGLTACFCGPHGNRTLKQISATFSSRHRCCISFLVFRSGTFSLRLGGNSAPKPARGVGAGMYWNYQVRFSACHSSVFCKMPGITELLTLMRAAEHWSGAGSDRLAGRARVWVGRRGCG